MQKKVKKIEGVVVEEKSNVIEFPRSVQVAAKAKAEKHWNHFHVHIGPHATHIIVGSCIVVLIGAGLVGLHEGLIHHIAIAILAERIASIGVASRS